MLKKNIALVVVGLSLSFASFEAIAGNQCQAYFNAESHFVAGKSYGEQIFLREFNLLEESFKKVSSLPLDEQIDSVIKNDGRRIIFHIRILSQSYEALDPKFFSKKVKQIKNFERLLGQVELYGKLRQRMIKTNEPKLAERFLKKRTQAVEQFRLALFKMDKSQSPVKVFSKMGADYDIYPNWLTGAEDRKFLMVEAINYARSINDKINRNGFDSDDLEKGLHNLRRRLREFTYRIVNWEGFVQLVDEGPLPPELEAWYNEMSAKNPNLGATALLPSTKPEVTSPILVAQKLEAMLAQIISDIGDIKVDHESLMYIDDVINNGKFDEDTKVQMISKFEDMRNRAGDQRDITHAFTQRLRESHLLDAVISFLESQID